MPSMMESLGFEKVKGRGNAAWYKHKDPIFTCLRCQSLGHPCLWRALLGDSYFGPFILRPCQCCSIEPGIKCDRCDAADEGFVLQPLNRHNWRAPCGFAFQNSFGRTLDLDFLTDVYCLRQIAKATCSSSLAAEEADMLQDRISRARSSFTSIPDPLDASIPTLTAPAATYPSASGALDAKRPESALLANRNFHKRPNRYLPPNEGVDIEYQKGGASKPSRGHPYHIAKPKKNCDSP